MQLVDIKRTSADKKAEKKRWEEPSSMEDYPYGLTIRLDNETIEKIGLGDLDAEETVMLQAEAFVSEDSVNKRNGKTHRSVSFQITKLAVGQSAKINPSDAAKDLYGGE